MKKITTERKVTTTVLEEHNAITPTEFVNWLKKKGALDMVLWSVLECDNYGDEHGLDNIKNFFHQYIPWGENTNREEMICLSNDWEEYVEKNDITCFFTTEKDD